MRKKHRRRVKKNRVMNNKLFTHVIALESVEVYNITDRKTLQSYKYNYFIKQPVMFLTRSNS